MLRYVIVAVENKICSSHCVFIMLYHGVAIIGWLPSDSVIDGKSLHTTTS